MNSIHPHRRTRRSAWAWALALVVLVGAIPAAAGSGHGYLGVHLQDLDEALLAALDYDDLDHGVLITEVVEDSPAEKAGLRQGDVILEFDDADARSLRGLTRRVRRTDAGETVTVRVLRKGEEKTFQVELGEAESRRGDVWFFGDDGDRRFEVAPDSDFRMHWQGSDRARLGVRIESLDEKLGRYFGTDEGVLVLGVEEDGAAEDAGLEPGDVIVALDGETIADTDDLRDELEDFEPGDEVELEILRERETRRVTVELEEGNVFSFFGDDGRFFAGRVPDVHRLHEHMAPRIETRIPHRERIRIERDGSDLREELEELRQELKELRSRLDESRES